MSRTGRNMDEPMFMTGLGAEMSRVGESVDPSTFMPEEPVPLDGMEAAEHADTISTLLLAFPYLYPPASNLWSEELEAEDPALVSLTLPEARENHADFYALSQTASRIAHESSFAGDAEEFTARARDLQATRVACRSQYRRGGVDEYAVPIPPLPAAG